MSLSVVTWKWHTPGFRSAYTAERVNALYRMVDKHYPVPYRRVCVTDDPSGLAADIDVVPLWTDWMDVPCLHGGGHPACYVRLKAFAPEMRDVLGPRFVSVDLDAVVVGDLRPLWDRPEPFVIWNFPNVPLGSKRATTFQGSMWMMDAGARPEVWERFRGAESAREAFDAGHHGNDQGWMHYVLGRERAAFWTAEDGVLSYKFDLLKKHAGALTKNAKIVFFHGKPDYWDAEAWNRAPWIREAAA